MGELPPGHGLCWRLLCRLRLAHLVSRRLWLGCGLRRGHSLLGGLRSRLRRGLWLDYTLRCRLLQRALNRLLDGLPDRGLRLGHPLLRRHPRLGGSLSHRLRV